MEVTLGMKRKEQACDGFGVFGGDAGSVVA